MTLSATFSTNGVISANTKSISIATVVDDLGHAQNFLNVSVVVDFPDGSTSTYALGRGVANEWNGMYFLKYTTKSSGFHLETWTFTTQQGVSLVVKNWLAVGLGASYRSTPSHIYVDELGGDPTGETDSTAALAAAMYIVSLAGPGVVQLSGGTYLSGNQKLYTGVTVDLGGGTIKLKNGSNTDLFSAQTSSINLGASNSSGIVGTLSNFSIRNGTLDGNVAHQPSGPSYPIRFYGYNFRLRDLEIKDGYSGGILCDWNGGDVPGDNASIEASLSDIKIHGCFGTGLQMGGPHDSSLRAIYSYDNQGNGFHFAPNAIGMKCTNIHPYSLGQSLNATSILCEAYGCSFHDCAIEGSDTVQLALLADDCVVMGGEIFGNPSAYGYGLRVGQQAGGSPLFGQILQSGGLTTSVAVKKLHINTKFDECLNGAMDFWNDAGSNTIIATIYQSSGHIIAAGHTPAYTNIMMVNVNGIGMIGAMDTSSATWIGGTSDSAFDVFDASGNDVFVVNTDAKELYIPNGTVLKGFSDSFTTQTCQVSGATGNAVFSGSLQLGGHSTFYSGSGAPAGGTGAVGDYYFRSDTPSTANQRIYIKTGSSTWTGIV